MAEKKKAEKKAEGVLKELLSLEEPLREALADIPDRPRAAANNVLGAISQLKDDMRTEESLKRKERDRGMAPEPAKPIAYRTATDAEVSAAKAEAKARR
jgi:hypothetical protein